MWGAAKRRSTSEGEGERLSSTLNLPEAIRFDRFNFYASTPQVNTTGFIDDNYESSTGTRLEPRVCTRSRGVTNSMDVKLREDFSHLKTEILKWGETVYSIFKTLNDRFCFVFKNNRFVSGKKLSFFKTTH